MSHRLTSLFLLLALAICPLVASAQQEGSAASLFNAFIASIASADIVYRTEVQLNADPANVPPGRLLGKSTFAGYFTFRAKTYEELTTPQRIALRNDARFKAFLVATRATMDGIVAGETNAPVLTDITSPQVVSSGDVKRVSTLQLPRERRRLDYFSLTPEELLQPRPIIVVVP